MFFFSFSPDFSSKIPLQPFKIETSYLVYRLQRQVVLWNENGPSLVCSSPNLFLFLSKFFVKDISTTVKDRNFIFGIQVHNDKLHCGIANGAFSYLFFLVFVPFSFFPNFSSKISPQPLKIETLYLVYRSTTTRCIVGLQMGILLYVLPFVCSFLFLSKFFVKDISTTIKGGNFIYGIQVHNHRLYCGIVNGPSPICSSYYLFVFLSFQIFRQRYLHNRLR